MSLKITKNNEEYIVNIAYMTGNKGFSTINVDFKKDNNIVKQEIYGFYPNHDLPIYEQAYLHLKTLPEFADAVDC